MKTIVYDHKGLGITELTAMSLYHPVIFSVCYFLISHNMARLALKIARFII